MRPLSLQFWILKPQNGSAILWFGISWRLPP